ncbi:fumarylacetoacetate hydrolase family protein [Streptomyces sp. NPDC048278]|uniref:fumarylacetoacetate hydrolase family protein n=1 Tax=Streptomyces sp. NPDC048278 TaxID=3155809 RepID=UPI0034183F40
MRLTTLNTPEGPRVGVLDGTPEDGAIRLLEAGITMLDLIRGGEEALADVARRSRAGCDAVPVDRAAFGPLLEPPSVRDFSTFEQHGIDMAGKVADEWYDQPLFYFTNPAAVTGAYAEIPVPPLATQYDYELEVAAVVGKAGSNLTPEQALDHIIGYTIMNDWSARDIQQPELRSVMGPSKSKDAALTLGPWLVTADELTELVEDGHPALTAEVRLNGRRMGGGTTGDMAWTFAELVAYAARGTVVRPGDVLGSGTVGSGCLTPFNRPGSADAPGWLRPGDVVRVEVEQLGFTENRLVPGPEPIVIPRGRRRLAADR